jgi:hypothetical protein
MRRESARSLVYTVSTEVGIVSVNADSIIFGLDPPERTALPRSIAFHELGCKMSRSKAKYSNGIPAEKRVDMDLLHSIHILP